MGRANRIIFEGAIYHIIMRGNNRDYILNSPKHKSFLIKQLKEYNKVLDFDLLAYAIMDNHYHLLIKANKDPISQVMFYINNVLGKYLSRELNRTGHIFQKRYICKLVTTDTYLIWLLRYLHRNPIRAGICTNIDEYRWTSHYFYKHGINSFAKTDFILNILSPRQGAARLLYLDLVNFNGDDANSEVDFQAMQLKYNFKDKPIGPIDADTSTELAVMQNMRIPLESIFGSLGLEDEVAQLLLSGSKKTSLTNYKLEFINEALRNKYTLKEIGDFLNVKSNSLSMLL